MGKPCTSLDKIRQKIRESGIDGLVEILECMHEGRRADSNHISLSSVMGRSRTRLPVAL